MISDEILSNTSKLKQYFDSSQLVYSIPRTVVQRNDSLAIDFDFQKDGLHIDIPENTKTLSPSELEANTLLGAGTFPAAPIDWNTLISDEVLIQVLQAKNWLHPDVSEKYQKLITSDLSYSQTLGGDPALDIPKMPDNRD